MCGLQYYTQTLRRIKIPVIIDIAWQVLFKNLIHPLSGCLTGDDRQMNDVCVWTPSKCLVSCQNRDIITCLGCHGDRLSFMNRWAVSSTKGRLVEGMKWTILVKWSTTVKIVILLDANSSMIKSKVIPTQGQDGISRSWRILQGLLCGVLMQVHTP